MLEVTARAARVLHRRVLALGLVLVVATSLVGAGSASAAPTPWMNPSLTPVQRADLLVGQMTLDEKIAMVHGAGFDTTRFFGCVGYIAGNARLGIPTLCLGDGPDGVGNGNTGVTQWPASINNAATWNRRMVRGYGAAYGAEQAGKGRNIALAPTINILRTPLWGRSFETFTEDPFLDGQLAVSEIHGIQSQHVIATPKHYVANNQEVLRNSIDVAVSQRALHEIYYPGFEAAVTRGGAGSVMCSYNRINGPYACENAETLNTVLKGQFGFDGFVMSDWGATHSTVDAANNGLDMEMPGGAGGFFGPEYFGQPLKDAVAAGLVPEARLDDMVRRILTSMFRIGLFDHPTPDPATVRDAVVSTASHQRLATRLSENGTVLLRNAGGVLPFDSGAISSIAVIGDDARDRPQTQGGGSAAVVPSHPPITPLDAITARAGSGVHVSYAVGAIPSADLPAVPGSALAPSSGTGPGLTGTYYATPDFSGAPVATQVDPSLDFDSAPVAGLPTQWSAIWTGTITAPADGTYTFSLSTTGETHIWVDGQLVATNPGGFGGTSQETSIRLQGGQPVSIKVDYALGGIAGFVGAHLHVGWIDQDSLIADAVTAARSSDVAVVFANDVASEGADRPTLQLPRWQDALISAVAAANPHTVVVLHTSGAVLMPWIDQVAGVVEAWYPGEQDGAAIAPILFGDVNPSGHLTETFPASATQGPAKTTDEYPGDGTTVSYDEGVRVGYRWYQSAGEQPLFPFGFGLSYTTFSFANVTVTPQASGGKRRIRVAFDVTNTGGRAGADAAQVYLGLPDAAGEPFHRLVGFQKVELGAGETRHVTVALKPDAHPLSFWDEVSSGWATAPGEYGVYVGDSSDAPLGATFSVGPRSGA